MQYQMKENPTTCNKTSLEVTESTKSDNETRNRSSPVIQYEDTSDDEVAEDDDQLDIDNVISDG